MNERSRLLALNTGRSGPLQCVAAATIFVFLVASGTTKTDNRRYSVVARVDAKSTSPAMGEIVVRIENRSVPATAIKASPDVPRNIAIVMDTGPNQVNVLSTERELAIALVNEMSDAGTSFTIACAGSSSKRQADTLAQSAAIEHIREITEDKGDKTNAHIYDALGSAIRQISLTPGLRVVIFIGEGNDGGSELRYAELRNLAESNQIAFFAALVADHSLHGPKSILRYGWHLRELTSDAAGIFLENQKTPKATQRLSEGVRGLRLITFDVPSHEAGRYKISVSVRRGKRLHAQKAIVIP